MLVRAFQSGMIPSGDLPELIAFAWTRDDSPTFGVSEASWIEVFERAGFFSPGPVRSSSVTTTLLANRR